MPYSIPSCLFVPAAIYSSKGKPKNSLVLKMQLSSSCLCDGLGLFTCGSWIAGVFSKSSPISLPCDWQSRVNFRKLLTFPVFPENTNKGVWDRPWDGNLDFKRHKKKTIELQNEKNFITVCISASCSQGSSTFVNSEENKTLTKDARTILKFSPSGRWPGSQCHGGSCSFGRFCSTCCAVWNVLDPSS